MKKNLSLSELIKLAAGHRPFGDPLDFGFETRLRSALGTQGPSLIETFVLFSFRFSCASLPVLLGVAAFLVFQHLSYVPNGIADVISHWTQYIPSGS